MVKTVIIFTVFASIVALSVFGFATFGFEPSDHSPQHRCPVAIFSSPDCATLGSALALVNYHLSALQGATQSISTKHLGLFSFVFFAFIFLTVTLVNLSPQNARSFCGRTFVRAGRMRFLLKLRRELLRWLAFHKKQGFDASPWAHAFVVQI